jgi:hypothetical protein
VLFEGASTGGDLTWFSFAKVIPRTLLSDKPEGDIDAFMANRLQLATHHLSPGIDLPTSNLAILLSDFGFCGVILAGCLTFAPIWFFLTMADKFSNHPFVSLFVAGSLFVSLSNVEGSPTTALVSLRDFVIWLVPLMGLEMIARSLLPESSYSSTA